MMWKRKQNYEDVTCVTDGLKMQCEVWRRNTCVTDGLKMQSEVAVSDSYQIANVIVGKIQPPKILSHLNIGVPRNRRDRLA